MRIISRNTLTLLRAVARSMCISDITEPHRRSSFWSIVSAVILAMYAIGALVVYSIGVDPYRPYGTSSLNNLLLLFLPFQRDTYQGNSTYQYKRVAGLELGNLIMAETSIMASFIASVMYYRLYKGIRAKEITGAAPSPPSRSQLLTPVVLTMYSMLPLFLLSGYWLVAMFIGLAAIGYRVQVEFIISTLICMLLTVFGFSHWYGQLSMAYYSYSGLFANLYKQPVGGDAGLTPISKWLTLASSALLFLAGLLVIINGVSSAITAGLVILAVLPMLIPVPLVSSAALATASWRPTLAFISYALLAPYGVYLGTWWYGLTESQSRYCSFPSYTCNRDGTAKSTRSPLYGIDCAAELERYNACIDNDVPVAFFAVIAVIGVIGWALALVGLKFVLSDTADNRELTGTLPTSEQALTQLRELAEFVRANGGRQAVARAAMANNNNVQMSQLSQPQQQQQAGLQQGRPVGQPSVGHVVSSPSDSMTSSDGNNQRRRKTSRTTSRSSVHGEMRKS